jgi:hypothetical protein
MPIINIDKISLDTTYDPFTTSGGSGADGGILTDTSIITNDPIKITTTTDVSTIGGKMVVIQVTSSPNGGAIMVDNQLIGKNTPATLYYDIKDFYTPKIFKSAPTDNYTTREEYRVSLKRTILGGSLAQKLIVEKLVDNSWQILDTYSASLIESISQINIDIPFSLGNYVPIDIITDNSYTVHLTGDMEEDGIIKYITSDGQTGFFEKNLANGLGGYEATINISTNVRSRLNIIVPWIEIQKVGIDSTTHNVKIEINDLRGAVSTYTNDIRRILTLSDTFVKVTVNKLIEIPDPQAPAIFVENDILQYNILSDEPLLIPYWTQFADKVAYSLGNTLRDIEKSGSLILTSADFKNGIGQYIIYLQPIGSSGNSGEIKRISISVISKTVSPGPDITHITYPENIKGADFIGYNENFRIGWQSVNTNYIEIYVSKYDQEFALSQVQPNGTLTLNVAEVLTKAKQTFDETTDIITFDLVLIPFNTEGDEVVIGKHEKISITFDKGDLRLRRAQVIHDIKLSFEENLKCSLFDNQSSKYLTHYAHLGGGINKLISNWDIDYETFATYNENSGSGQLTKTNDPKSLVLKLYEPLPKEVQPNQQLWLSKLQSVPIVNQIVIEDLEVDSCVSLTPNFDMDLGDEVGYQILDDLVASGSLSSTELIQQYVGNNQFSLDLLNLQYYGETDYNWEGFVKYSSAVERAENFYYKIKTLEFYSASLYSINEAINSTTSSLSTVQEAERTTEKISNLKKGFDAFEYLMYNSSGSLSYPGAGTDTISLYSSTETQTWYTTIIGSATEYDLINRNSLVNNIPQHLLDDSNGADFLLFFNMVGQHFDVLSSYTEGIISSKKVEHSNDSGVINDLLYHMLESLGWDADMGVKSQYLWEYAFGQNKDGTTSSAMSGKDRQQEVWRRLLNNLPFLYKHKGTKRALYAAMACYGVPSSMLTILEFGGPKDITSAGTTSFSFDDRSSAALFNGSSSIIVPWNNNSGTYPNSVEIRVNSQYKQDQILLQTEQWSVQLIASTTGSEASIQFSITGSGNLIESSSTDYFPFFNDEYTQIVIQNTLSGSSNVFDLYAKEGYNERIRNEGSASLIIPTGSNNWNTAYDLIIGSTFSGSIDEFRLWTTPLEETVIENHTLMGDAINGNNYSSSTEDLLLRFDFEYPKNLGIAGAYLPNVAINQTYGFTQAVNPTDITGFVSITDYPYNYVTYERVSTAQVPATGIGFANKIRFESQTLENYLKFGSLSNVTSFDNADDSNKLGLFLSPTHEVNMDIVRSLGSFNIDNYIGDPGDEYQDTYSSLDSLRKYYFGRYTLNMSEYIQLIRYIDASLFKTLKSLVPARADVASGLLIQPHFLERSKQRKTKPVGQSIGKEVSIDVNEDINISSDYRNLETTILTQEDVVLELTTQDLLGEIDTRDETIVSGENQGVEGTIHYEDSTTLSAETLLLDASIIAVIDTEVEGQYYNDSLQTVGMDPDGITNAGFGLWAVNGHSIRTHYTNNNYITQSRFQVYQIKESYIVDIPTNISPDGSLGTEMIPTTFYRYKVTLIPFPSGSVQATAPSVGGNIVEVIPLDGYFPSHYRNVGDLSTGLQNSWYNGSKQTSATTLDGGSPVETFTTNPNTLRVNDAGRGSGEPILEVD